MSFIAPDPHHHAGTVVDNGHCMRHVQVVAAVPHSSTLRRGAKVRGAGIPRGTVIGTFHPETGRYENDTSGRSHIAVYLSQDESGIRVIDQWIGKPVGERTIRFKDGQGQWVDDGDRYHVVESA
jgi:catechol 2,3-dioxygenase-like lactoylglutathione lyase family enzyme